MTGFYPTNLKYPELGPDIYVFISRSRYPTLATLAGLPKPSSTDGVDLSPLLMNPLNTNVSVGAFMQQARCYQKGAATPNPTALQATLTRMMTCEFVPRDKMDFMGYSIRTREWRYTAWLRWDGSLLAPMWNASVGVELYDHRAATMPAHGHSGWRENENLAAVPAHAVVVSELHSQLKAHFSRH
jgi:hypothetical protein